ncbi:MAG: hypothetical protein SangKO_035970 [Sandaracinaceae bacterium]
MQQGDILAGRYRLIARLGEGGMGEVWRAEQVALGREVAVKLVRGELNEPHARERFRREAELAAKVQHRNVVDILDFGTIEAGDTDDSERGEDTQYLVMPLLEGETLHARLHRTRPALRDLLVWMRGLLSGLAAIHDRGIVHRDLKPANVFLAEDDDGVIPKLLDFGISRAGAPTGTQLTAQNTGIGTPQYMAPEQFESARDVDARADVWGAGAIFYEALAGRPPFGGDDAFAVYKAVLQTEPEPLGALRAELPVPLSELVHRALSRDPAARFRDGREMRDALDALIRDGALGAIDIAISSPGVAATQAMSPSPISGDAPTLPASSDPQLRGAVNRTVGLPEAAPTAALASKGSTRRMLWIGLAGAVAIAGAAGLFFAGAGGESVEPETLVAADAPSDPERAEDAGPAMSVGPTAPPSPRGFRVTGARPLEELAFDWAELPESQRARPFRFTRLDDGWVARLPGDTPSEAIGEISRGLRGVVVQEPYEPSAGVRPARMHSTVRLSLRREPTTDRPNLLRVLPHDAVAVALYGEVDGARSAAEGEDAFTHVAISRSQRGWVTARFLAPLEACLPSAAAVLDEIVADLEELYGGGEVYGELGDEGEAEDLYGQAERTARGSLTLRTHAWIEGRRQPVFLVVGTNVEMRDADIIVYGLDPTCEIDRLASHHVSGVLDEVFLTETIRGGGQTLLVTSHAPRDSLGADGVRAWTAKPLHRSTEVWSARLPTEDGLPDHRRASVSGTRDRAGSHRREPFALTVRSPGAPRQWWVWEGDALVSEDGAEEEAGGASEETPP